MKANSNPTGQNGLRDDDREKSSRRPAGLEHSIFGVVSKTGDPIGTMGRPKDNFVLRIS